MSKTKLTAVAVAVVGSLFSGAAFSAEGYLNDSQGGIVRSGNNECWHVSDFDRAKHGLVECGEAEPVAAAGIQTTVFRVESDVIFGFDSVNLTSAGRDTLRDIVSQIQSNQVNLQQVEVVGHTDAIGTRQYNLALSQRRAATVANYIVDAGLPSNLVSAIGVGFDQAQFTEQCRGSGGREAYIACLSPDRKVEIKVSGSAVVQD